MPARRAQYQGTMQCSVSRDTPRYFTVTYGITERAVSPGPRVVTLILRPYYLPSRAAIYFERRAGLLDACWPRRGPYFPQLDSYRRSTSLPYAINTHIIDSTFLLLLL